MTVQDIGRFAFVLLILLPSLTKAENWPQFRGPDGSGHAASRDAPMQWSEQQNIRWKTPIAGLGWSSPAIWGDQVWLTTAVEAEGSLRAVCVDRNSGQIVHDVEVFKSDDLGRIASKNSHASPTPVLDGQHVFVHFGAHGTACLTNDGKVVWHTKLKYDHRHGPGSSPIAWNDTLIVTCDGPDAQFLVALDKETGQQRWRVDHDGEQAYSTPLVAQVDGKDQLITSRANAVIAYAPGDGQELWRLLVHGTLRRAAPVVAGDLVYCCTGYWNPSLLAIRVGGSGDVTGSHVAFTVRRGVPLNSSPLVVDGRLYLTTHLGVLTCIDAATGKELCARTASRQLLRVADVRRRQDLPAERGRDDAGHRGGRSVQVAGDKRSRQAARSRRRPLSTGLFFCEAIAISIESGRHATGVSRRRRGPVRREPGSRR